MMKQPEIGLKVADLRSEKGMTQEQLAELCEVSTRTIQRIESGEVDPRSFTLNSLSRNLDYNFGESQDTENLVWLISLHISSVFCIVLVPLLIWMFKKNTSDAVDRQGREVLNFQLTMTILLFGAAILSGLIVIILVLLVTKQTDISEPRMFLLFALSLIPLFSIGAICLFQGLKNAICVIQNRKIRYPFCIPFIKGSEIGTS